MMSDETRDRQVNYDDIVKRYKRLRAASVKLNHQLVKTLSKDQMDEGGRKLGLLQGGILVFKTDDETSVLMDYCIYDVYRNGRNAVERFLQDSPPPPDSEEMQCLNAMREAFYSVFVAESVIPNVGITARDVVSDRHVLIVDVGFGNSGKPGVVLASRIMSFDDFSMTCGAAIPIGLMPKGEPNDLVNQLGKAMTSQESGKYDPANLIKTCLSAGASRHIRYEDAGQSMPHPGPRMGPSRQVKVGRNDLCPCGSGKKYKHCCLKKR